MRQRKAQVELVAILGLVVIAIVVVIFAFQFPTQSEAPPEIANQQRLVRESVTSTASEGARLAIERLEQTGGYIEDPVGVAYTGVAVSYWSACETNLAPSLGEIKPRLEGAVKNHLLNTLQPAQEFQGKEVLFDLSKLKVEANILDGKIDFIITLPASIEGYAFSEPYFLSTSTNFKELYNFASDFANEAVTNRPFEKFTLASIYLSSLPTKGVLSQCGEVVYLSPEEVSQKLESIVLYGLVNTEWWRPIRPASGDETKTYSIESVSGNKYPSIRPSLKTVPGLQISVQQPVFLKNTKHVMNPTLVFRLPQCVVVYNQRYALDYPLVVTAKDKLTGNDFNFASYVYLSAGTKESGMVPGSCSAIQADSPSCDSPCTASFQVTRLDSSPIENAQAFFGSCKVGNSDALGRVSGPVACGLQNLTIVPPNTSFDFLEQETTAAGIASSYQLPRKPMLSVAFNHVTLINVKTTVNPFVPEPSPSIYTGCSITPAGAEDRYSVVDFQYKPTGQEYYINNMDPPEVQVDYSSCKANPASCYGNPKPTAQTTLPEGQYNITAELRQTNPPENGLYTPYIRGAFKADFEVQPEDSPIYINIPLGIDSIDSTPGQKQALAQQMKAACGLETVSYSPQLYGKIIEPKLGCFTCSGLKHVFESEASASAEDISALFRLKLNLDGSMEWNCKDTIENTIDKIASGYNVMVNRCA